MTSSDRPPAQLRRLHPLTPVFRSWRLIGAVAALGLGAFRDDFDRLRFLWDALRGEAELSVLVKVALVVLAAALVAVLAAWLSWRVTWFAIVAEPPGPGTLLLHRGLVVRQRSQVRLSRVQSVDVNQPLAGRLIGLADVRLEMAAGDDASVSLAYLGVKDAWALREEILRHTSATVVANGREISPLTPQAGAGDDLLVAEVSTAHLVKAALLEGTPAMLLAVGWLIGLTIVATGWGVRPFVAGLTGIVPVTLAILVQLRKQALAVLTDANFRLYRTSAGIRISAGLTSTVNRTIDTDRIQGIRVEEPFVWRRLRWARVEVDVAGAADQGKAASLMPVATRSEALALVRELTGVDLEAGQPRPAGAGARRLDPLGWRYLAVMLHDHGAVAAYGRWRQTRFFVPYARAQSVSVQQGWLQRRLGVASLFLDMPKGVSRWSAHHRDVTEAGQLADELAERARRHRRPLAFSAPGESRGSKPGESEPAVDATDGRSDHEGEHETAYDPSPDVQHRP
ncbi:MAG: PH domain-containing protein [Propionibacteriales bacterium]|nr:PH domain-containing protein [Propionibacteriales bacterium]